MKKIVFTLVCLVAAFSVYMFMLPAKAGKIGSDCSYKGKRLYGKVQIVSSFGDFKVQAVNSFPDLKVQKVTSFPDSCGKWEFVNSFPDFKVEMVSSFPDFTIQYVSSFPGVN